MTGEDIGELLGEFRGEEKGRVSDLFLAICLIITYKRKEGRCLMFSLSHTHGDTHQNMNGRRVSFESCLDFFFTDINFSLTVLLLGRDLSRSLHYPWMFSDLIKCDSLGGVFVQHARQQIPSFQRDTSTT